MKILVILINCIFLIPLFSEKLLYRSKSFIAPRKFVQNEISLKKKEERKRAQEEVSDECSGLELKPDRNRIHKGKSLTELIIVPESLYRKYNGIIYSRKEFSVSVLIRGDQSRIKKLCFSDNSSGLRTYKGNKLTISSKGIHRLIFAGINNENEQIIYSEATVFLDYFPPEINVSKVDQVRGNKEPIKCNNGDFFQLNSFDPEVDLTHSYYRKKNTFSWKYYLDPVKSESAGLISYEAMAEDIAGNQSRVISFDCGMGNQK